MTEQSETNGRNRRSWRNMLVKPREQLKHAFFFVGGGVLVASIFIAIVLVSLSQLMTYFEQTCGLDPAAGQTVMRAFSSTLVSALVLLILLSLFAFVVGVRLMHRIYGPMVPIQRHIAELKKGNYDSRIHLRKGDDLTELQDSLNDLAEYLKKK